jgi:hypothetical protein
MEGWLMKKRYRTPKAKVGQLLVKYGQEHGERDLFYCWNESSTKRDSRIVMAALEREPIFEGRNLRDELELRGYDITTLQFSIMKKSQESK